MSDRKLLFMMRPKQLMEFLRLQQDAEAGDGAAACRLGDMYREGLNGLCSTSKETVRWYSRSALAGDANGQNNLGACYEHALGCGQSYAKAVKWYRLSAAQKLGTASMNLGYCHLHGHGVPADKGEALRLFRLAPEWAAARLSRGGHGYPHGRAPRAASAAREVGSQPVVTVQFECGSDENDCVIHTNRSVRGDYLVVPDAFSEN